MKLKYHYVISLVLSIVAFGRCKCYNVSLCMLSCVRHFGQMHILGRCCYSEKSNILKCRLRDLTYPEIKLLHRGLREREASKMGREVEDGLDALFTVCKTVRYISSGILCSIQCY